MKKKYTIQEIRTTWESYRKAKGWRVTRNGKEKIHFSPPNVEGATSAEMINVRHFIDFPEYLEMVTDA